MGLVLYLVLYPGEGSVERLEKRFQGTVRKVILLSFARADDIGRSPVLFAPKPRSDGQKKPTSGDHEKPKRPRVRIGKVQPRSICQR